MATIINNPPNQNSDEGMGVGLIVGIVITVLVVFLFAVYGLPLFQSNEATKTPATQKVEVTVPAVTTVVTSSTTSP